MGWLDGRAAVVTGAGRGIGRAVALALAAEGAKLVVNDLGVNVDGTGLDQSPAALVASEIREHGGIAVPNYDSVATVQGGENIINTCVDNFGRIDILVNTAGILRDRMIFNMTEEEWDSVITVHLKGHYCTTKPASIVMRRQRYGRIINFSSSSGLIGNPGQANYAAAKAGIVGFTRVVARDLGRYGITVNAIAPSAETRMLATVPQQSRTLRAQRGIDPNFWSSLLEPEERTPEHVAPMVVYLASEGAAHINGQIFYVGGGFVGIAPPVEVPIRSIFKRGMWTLDELERLVTVQLMYDIVNPAPPEEQQGG